MLIVDPANAVPNVPDDYLIAIGKVCVQWGNLETVMELSLTKMAGMDIWDPRPKIMINHMAWPMRVDIFSAIADKLVPEHPRLKNYQSVLPLLKKAQEGRNWVVHSNWGLDDGKVTAQRASARGKLKLSMDAVTVDEIEGVWRDINVATAALYNLVFGNP